MTLCRTDDLAVGRNGIPVVEGLELRIDEGEIVALLGPNGAGKTTTILTLAGELRPISGQVLWRERRATGRLSDRARRGLGLVTEERCIFRGLTVLENLRVGPGPVDAALDVFAELRPLLHRKAGVLSGGEQQMLALARALAADPSLLLVDELSLGLAPLAVERLLLALRDAASRGTAVLLVEQHVDMALGVCDRALVVSRGRTQLEGSASELNAQRDAIERAYLVATSEVEGSAPTATTR